MQNNRLLKLQEMLSEKPDDIFLNYALAMEYKGQNQVLQTIQQLEKVLLLDENHVASLYQMGVLMSENNENEKAVLFLEKGLTLVRQNKDLKTANEFKALLDEIMY